MKRFLIISDTHGYTDPCLAIMNNERFHAIIHAGDYTRDAEDLEFIFPDIPIYYVKGNNDILSRAPSELTVICEGVKIFITHGHEQRVKYESRYDTLRTHALKKSPDLVVFGHTHIPYVSYDDGMTILNPGSVRYSKTYAVAELSNGQLKTKIIDI